MHAAKVTIQRLPLAARGAIVCGLVAFVFSVTVTSTWYDSAGVARVESYDFVKFGFGLLAIALASDGLRQADGRRHPKIATLATSAVGLSLGIFHLLTSWDPGVPFSAI